MPIVSLSFSSRLTLAHAPLQDGAMSEDEGVEDRLAGGVEGPVQCHIAEGLRARVLAIDVAMQPWDQQVQTCPYCAAGPESHNWSTQTTVPLKYIRVNGESTPTHHRQEEREMVM